MERIDVHSHVLFTDLVDHLEGRQQTPTIEHRGDRRFIRCAPGLSIPVIALMTDLDVKLREMDRLHVDMAVLSYAVPGPEMLRGAEADEWATRMNDYLAKLVKRAPDRLHAWGVIGFGDPQRSREEMRRCVEELGFPGFQLFSNIAGRPLDSPEILEVIEYAPELNAVLNMHPTVPLNTNGMDDFTTLTGIGFVVDTSLNTLRLIMSGVFDRQPDLRLIVPHIGGVLPYLRGRVAAHSGTGHIQGEQSGLRHSVDDYLRKLYVDTVTGDVPALRCAYELLGADHLMWATDHPFANPDEAAGILEGLGLDDDEARAIYSGNARRLLGLDE